MKKYIFLSILITVVAKNIFADGLMLPNNNNYPKEFLRNKSTEINVDIQGVFAKTVVRQEFINEWSNAVDAVYSFPLPNDARAINIFYWRNDTIFKAVLKVQQQDVNPGTGDGGVTAEVNKYLGKNAIRIALKNIPAYSVQRIELHYISLLDFYYNKCTYTYPLNTENFVTHPLDYLKIAVNIQSNSKILNYESTTHQGFNTINSNDNYLHTELRKPKAYTATDFVFSYTIDYSDLTTDFYSFKSDTADGYFNLFVRSPSLQKRVVLGNKLLFLIGNSSRMTGYKIQQTIEAISESLDKLRPLDKFNIMLFNNSVEKWQNELIDASDKNIAAAKEFLSTIETSGGSNMDKGIKEALKQYTNNDFNNAILAFSDGYSVIDPLEISELNQHNTGIFIAGIGYDLDKKRLEMTANYNHGFVTYLQDDNIKQGIQKIFGKIYQPLLKNIAIDYKKDDIYALLPVTLPAVYAGSYFMVCGRYKKEETITMQLNGENASGAKSYSFDLNFEGNNNETLFAAILWAKQAIDALEQQIHIYGEDDVLKDSLIELSLKYNIRCRYTAYIADYKNNVGSIGDEYIDWGDDMHWRDEMTSSIEPFLTETYRKTDIPIQYVYPNPFAGKISLVVHVNEKRANQLKLLKIFDVFGRLIAVIDISYIDSGRQILEIDLSSYNLAKGLYIMQLQIGDKVEQNIKIQKL